MYCIIQSSRQVVQYINDLGTHVQYLVVSEISV